MAAKIYSFLLNLRWQDFIDILINSYIVFRVYVLFRGTATFRVMMGIAGLLLFQQIASYLGLVVTSWLIQGVMTVAAIIVIVIFRNEIRSVFQTANWKNILWGIPKYHKITPTETIVDTIFELASSQTGALIVFPGKENLQNVMQKGVSLQGQVSKEMLKTIFWRNNPVHDGATIIEDDKISEVACILPLSVRSDLPSAYGTRHRAAAGLAERSDAMVAVVSEERGTVSVAKGNDIENIKTPQALIDMIDRHLGKKTENNLIKKETFQLSLAALLSIVLIASVWSNFLRSSDTLINLEVPIQFKNLPPNMEIVNASVDTVRLQISGSSALLRSVSPERVHVDINLENAAIGENNFVLNSDKIPLPPGITLNQIIPAAVTTSIDSIVTKYVPVQVNWTGTLPDHLLLASVQVEPPRVHITGKSMLLKDVHTAYTKKVPLETIIESGTLVSEIALEGSIKLATRNNEPVTIRYTVTER